MSTTNSNLQQINVFNKGMNTDTSDAYLSNELYRYAENLRFITDTGENSGELRLIEGYSLIVSDNGEIWFHEGGGDHIIAITSVRNLVIFLTNKLEDGDIHAEIVVFDEHGFVRTPFKALDGFQWNGAIRYSLVTRWESDDNIKLYIADGEHELMSINIMGSVCNKISLLTDNVNIQNYHFDVRAEEGGNLTSPIVLYCYYFYNPGGLQSDMSRMSSIIRLYAGLDEGYIPGKVINAKVKISIPVPRDVQYSRIRVFRLLYEANGETPQAMLICDELLDNTSDLFEYYDTGGYLQTESVASLLSNIKYRFIPRVVESKEDRLFAANIKDVLREVDQKFNNFEFDVNSDFKIISKTYSTNGNGKLIDEIENYGPSLMRGETYRYGIIFYLKDGTKSSVRHLCDITIPNYDGFVLITNNTYKFERYGVEFTIRIPEEVRDECVGFEIVRCQRTIQDSRTLFSGIGGCTFLPGYSDLLRYASVLMSMQKMYNYHTPEEKDVAVSDLLMFASPESVYLLDDALDVLNQYESDLYIKMGERYEIGSSEATGLGIHFPNLVSIRNGLTIIGKEDDSGIFFSGYPFSRLDRTSKFDFQNVEIPYNTTVVRPQSLSQLYLADTNLYKITKFAGTKSPDAKFNDGDTIIIDKDSTNVGDKLFINWDGSFLFNSGELDLTYSDLITALKNPDPNASSHPSISSGKNCILLSAKNVPTLDYNGYTNAAPISILNIIHKSCVPYGGTSKSAMANNVYYSHGDYMDVSNSGETKIEVFTGDTFGGMFVYHSAHAYCSDRYYASMRPTVYCVPIESRIDLQAVYGDLYTKITQSEESENDQYESYSNTNGNFHGPRVTSRARFNDYPACMFLDYAGKYYDLVQEKDAYMYNTIYSGQSLISSYTPNYLEGLTDPSTDTRIHYSDPKTNGELIDNWTKFKPMNFLDVDSRYGEITGLRLFKNSLVYWLNGATGVLSVNERTMLLDVNDTNIILGNGDVLQRYDYLSLKYGMTKDLFCDTQSDNILYWWDEYNKDLIMYPGGQSVAPMKIAKNVSNLINTGTVTVPTLAYDNKYKEILFADINERTLVYNEVIQLFTSLYDVRFQHVGKLDDKLLLINTDEVEPDAHKLADRIYQWNSGGDKLKPRLKYIVNDKNTFTKVYDNVQIGMGNSFYYDIPDNATDANYERTDDYKDSLKFDFRTTGQHAECTKNITDREFDLRFAIPRSRDAAYCERMRGRTMQCELTSEDSSAEFSIQYIITKYRISWS